MGEMVQVTVPPVPRGAVSAWRVLARAVTEAGELDGAYLAPGLDCDLPAGALVLAADRFTGCHVVRLYKAAAGAGGLEAVRTWTQRSRPGAAVARYTAARLEPGAARHRYVLPEGGTAGVCRYCQHPVRAGTGHAWQDARTGEPRPAHERGLCPARLPLPEREEPNLYGGACARCGAWVPPETGAVILAAAPEPGSRARYQPVHGRCPAQHPAGPVNARDGLCAGCSGPLSPGDGCWVQRDGEPAPLLRHQSACPRRGPYHPSWLARLQDGWRGGDVVRAAISLGAGGPLITAAAPGYLVLAGGYVQVTAVVLGISGGQARVRAATAEEAARLGSDPEPEAHPDGYRAAWRAERIGTAEPWLARLAGFDPVYGYDRKFLKPKLDYRDANRKLTRGVYYTWTLRLNEVYQAQVPLSWSATARVFVRATPDGDTAEITREEADAWLRQRLPVS